MVKTEHTPGPWLWAENEDGNPYALMAAQTENYYVVWPYSNCLDVSAANARLIAAAPDLLEALIDAAAMLDAIARGQWNWDGSTEGQARSTAKDARAAIAKATEGTN